MTLRRTTDRLPHVRYGTDSRVEFEQDVRESDEYDADTEEWAATTFDELERVEDESDEHTADDREAERKAAEVVTEEDHAR